MKCFIYIVGISFLYPIISALNRNPFEDFTDQDKHDLIIFKVMNQGGMDFVPHSYSVEEAQQLLKRLPRSLSKRLDMVNAGHLSVNGDGEVPKLKDLILMGGPVDCGPIKKPHACFDFRLSRSRIDFTPSRVIFKMIIKPEFANQRFRAYLTNTDGENWTIKDPISDIQGTHEDYEDEIFIDITTPMRTFLNNTPSTNKIVILVLCETCGVPTMELSGPTISAYNVSVIDFNKNQLQVTPPHRRKRSSDSAEEILPSDCEGGLPGRMDRCCRIQEALDLNEGKLRNLNIVLPTRLPLHLCGGSCQLHDIPERHRNVEYTNAVLGYLTEERRRKFLDHLPCCSANKTSTLNLLTSTGGENYVMRYLPLTLVEECACA